MDTPIQGDGEGDGALLARLQAGEESAFDELMRAYQAALSGFVLRLLGDADDAADVVQETFVKAWQRIGDFRGGSGLYTWLYRIAYNNAVSRLRRRKVRRFLRLDREDDGEPAPRLQLVSAEDPGRDLEQAELLRHVQAAIEQLPPRQRGIFVMRHYEGMSHAEIARVVGRSEGAIRAGYFHAVRKVREAARLSGLLDAEEEA